MERRSAEIRADIRGNTLSGHAAVFGQETRVREFYEEVDKRAFDRVLRDRQDTVLQAEHVGLPMARTSSGTLKLTRDSTGLAFEADLPDTSLARDVRTLVDRGDLSAMSFGFQVGEDLWSVRSDGAQKRIITDISRLFDISVVTFPAYAGTDVALRSDEFPTPPTLPLATARGQAARIRARLLKEWL